MPMLTNDETERRALTRAPAELRADAEAPRVQGYAAVFDERAEIAGLFEEEIAPGAFARALREQQDVPLLINHEGLPLARTASATLRLSENDRGLAIDADLDAEDFDAQRVIGKLRRGDLSSMSFAFTVRADKWTERDGQLPLRRIEDVDLYDVAVVTTPAYAATSIALSARSAVQALQRRASRSGQQMTAQRRLRARLLAAEGPLETAGRTRHP